jgi:hypothetical protein
VAHYRIYILSPAGRIFAFHEVECDADEDAIQHGRSLLTALSGVEIWNLCRRVAQLSALDLLPSYAPL